METLHILVHWDAKTVRPSNAEAFKATDVLIERITKHYQEMYPDKLIRFHVSAYGDRMELDATSRAGFLNMGATMNDVVGKTSLASMNPREKALAIGVTPPAPGQNRKVAYHGCGNSEAADRQMIAKIFEFAADHPPPAVIILVSGDSDFLLFLRTLKLFNYTTICVFKENEGTSEVMKGTADFDYYYEKLMPGENRPEGILEGPSNQAALCLKQRNDFKLKCQINVNLSPVLLLWDLDSMRHPANLHKEACVGLVEALYRTLEEAGKPRGVEYFKIFGEKRELPSGADCYTTATYVATSGYRNTLKEHNVENEVIHAMLHFGHLNRPHATIALVTAQKNYAGVLRALRYRGYTTIICAPEGSEYKLLKDAASLQFQPPWK